MSGIAFHAQRKVARLHDPRKGFALVEVESEVRADPLTGDSARICHFALNVAPPADLDAMVATSRAHCPFCPEKVEAITPRFPEDLVPGGRLRRGEALLFPNLFPYDDISAIVVLCDEHFHALGRIPERIVVEGLTAARDFLRLVTPTLAGEAYGVVTWNYMPAAGATQVHPHMQVIATGTPGNGLRRQLEAGRAWHARHGRPYADMLLAAERDGPRWIGEDGAISWLVPFTPAGLLGDAQAVFARAATVADLGDDDIAAFARGLVRVLRGFATRGLWSFNLCFLAAPFGSRAGAHRLVARVLPRLFLNPALHVSDVAYMHLLLEEKFAMAWPEDVAAGLRAAWNGGA